MPSLVPITFIILSFEGPDRYAHAGGLGSRVTGLTGALADQGFETHLFFIGDPHLPGHESRGSLHLHRWCQWISAHHPAGVYDGEEGKLADWNRSLPAWIESEIIRPRLEQGGQVIVLGEEWQTAWSLVETSRRLRHVPGRDRAHFIWNANNLFSFDRVPWDELRSEIQITTVSRYMKHAMWQYRVDPRVVPNGIPESWLEPVERDSCHLLRRMFRNRLTLVKVGRWDPDKRWEMAVDAVAILKRCGLSPLFLARGGMEAHGEEVLARAAARGLVLRTASWTNEDVLSLARGIRPALGADMMVLTGYLSERQRRALFHVAGAVLANSGLEPFGLVGLETMAVGGIAFVGSTGEDYVTHGHDAISLQTSEPSEIAHHAVHLHRARDEAARIRRAARKAASRYTWPAVIRRVLLRFLQERGIPLGPPSPEPALSYH